MPDPKSRALIVKRENIKKPRDKVCVGPVPRDGFPERRLVRAIHAARDLTLANKPVAARLAPWESSLLIVEPVRARRVPLVNTVREWATRTA